MTRKRARYRPRRVSPPMLVNRCLHEADIESRERLAVEAFAGGWASCAHFDVLCDMRNVLTLANVRKNDPSIAALTEAMRIPLGNLRERYAQNGRFAVTGDELCLLRAFVDAYRDYWLRQSVAAYEAACDALDRAYQSTQPAPLVSLNP